MKNKPLSLCINQILQDIENRKVVDYGDKMSLRRYNAAMDRIYNNAKYIDSNYPEQIQEFINLMFHSDTDVSLTCASIVINLIHCDGSIKRDAISIVRKLYESGSLDPITALTIPLSLKKWDTLYSNKSE